MRLISHPFYSVRPALCLWVTIPTRKKKDINFLETTLIGDVDMDDFFPDEQLDSTMVGKSQNHKSRITFNKSKEYANRKYNQYKDKIHSPNQGVAFLDISK